MKMQRRVMQFDTDSELQDYLNAMSTWKVLYIGYVGHAQIGWTWHVVVEGEV